VALVRPGAGPEDMALADLFRRNKVRWLPKFGWALIIILVNLFGSLAYLLFGREEA